MILRLREWIVPLSPPWICRAIIPLSGIVSSGSVESSSSTPLIVFMHLLRSMHPPGGATALIAVVGGDRIRGLGLLVRAVSGAVRHADPAGCRARR